MKKGISLVLAICMMLMAIPAFAAETVEGVVLQNELPPQIVPIGEENGATIVATVHDANGNATNVTDDGSLSLVDVHERGNIEDEAVAKRLTDAYHGVMYDVHYSDVEAIHHDDIIKIDINAALAGHSEGLIAYDLIKYELFDVMLYGELAGLLGEGGYLEFTVQLEEMQPLPLMILFTPDGAEWEILENYTFGENKTITIRLAQPGTLAFLLEGEAFFAQDEEYPVDMTSDSGEIIEDVQPEDGPFTPSVTGKPAPSVVPFEGENGEVYVGAILYGESGELVPIPDGYHLIVTPLAERDYVVDIQTHEHLEWSYDDILAAGNMEALEQGIDEEINAVLAAGGYDLLCDDMVMRDLFEITVYGEYLEHFYNDGVVLEITFDVEVAQDEPFVVLFSSDSVTWHVLPVENFTINQNGTLTIRLAELGTVAFLIERVDDLFAADDAVLSPE